MKNPFYFLLLFVFSISFLSCDDDDKKTTNPIDQLPPITQTGKNTFGCLINGEPFNVRNTSLQTAIYQGGILQIGAYIETNSKDQGIIIWLDREIEVGETYVLNENVSSIGFFKDYISGCVDFQTFSPNSGTITIKSFDQNNFTISGTFEFKLFSNNCQENINITSGRFDLQYIP